MWNLRKLGVEVHSVKEPSSGDDMIDDVVRFMASYQGAAESRVKSQDTQRGKKTSVHEHGVFHGRFPPYGYRRTDEMTSPMNAKKKIVVYGPDPKQAPIVEEIFRRYLAGDSPHRLATDLNEGVRDGLSCGIR